MKEIFEEYGAMILAAVGSLALLNVVREPLFAADGLLATMIALWGNGGC